MLKVEVQMAERDYFPEDDKETIMKRDRDWRWTQIEIVIIALFLMLAAFAAVTVGVLREIG
jgi:hypothetical protein